MRRQAAVAHQVADEILQSVQQAGAASVDQLLQRRRVAGERVGRRHRVHQQRDDEARALGVALVELGVVEEAVERVAPGQVALRQRPVGDALLPGRIGEALVLGVGRELAGAGRDPAELAEQRQTLLGGRGRMAQHLAEQQARGVDNVLAAHPDQRIGRERVLRRLLADVVVAARSQDFVCHGLFLRRS